MTRDGRRVGLIQLSGRYTGEFTADDEAILAHLARRASVAIENLWLYEQVKAGREHLRALSRRLVEVQEEERRRLARELHDDIGQILTSLKFALEAGMQASPEMAAVKLDEARVLIEEGMTRVREVSSDLRPAVLDHLGLLPALRWLTDRYTTRTGVSVNFKHTGLAGRIGHEIETAAFRIVQEALTNVARHARVEEVAVRLWTDAENLIVQIEDHGVGFDSEEALAAGHSGGLTGMGERVMLLGGRWVVESMPGSGTHLMAELPLSDQPGGEVHEHFDHRR